MDFLKQNMMPILAGIVLLGGIYAYMTYFSSPSQPAALTSSDSDASVSQKVLVTLQNLHGIKLDDSIFSDPAYQSLTDFGVTIPPQTPGRRNPFAPLDAAPAQNGAGSVNISLPNTGTPAK